MRDRRDTKETTLAGEVRRRGRIIATPLHFFPAFIPFCPLAKVVSFVSFALLCSYLNAVSWLFLSIPRRRAPGHRAAAPGPLKVVAAEPAIHIHNFPGEEEARR